VENSVEKIVRARVIMQSWTHIATHHGGLDPPIQSTHIQAQKNHLVLLMTALGTGHV
jgi:hypothetical protein